MTVRARYEISAEDKTKAAIASASKGLSDIKGAALSLQGALAGLGAAFSLKAVIDNTARQEQAVKQLEAALISTGGAMGYTREELVGMAAELQKVTTFGDEAIIEAQARLVTYTGIVGEQFPRALQSVLDQSARLNIGLEQSAEIIGRALESPIKAAGALSQQGFGAAFTDEVKKMIEALVEAGREGEAQSIILGILEDSYGGAARAARDTFGGALQALQNAFGDLLEADGRGLNDARLALESFVDLLSDPAVISAANALTTAMIDGFAGAAKTIVWFVETAQWMGEQLARSVHGAADPIQRLDDEIALLQERVVGINDELERPRAFRINPFIGTDDLRAEMDVIEKELVRLRAARAELANIAPAAEAPAAPTAPPARRPPPPSAGGGRGRGGARVDITKALIDRETALIRDALQRQQRELDVAYQDGLVSTAAYFTERARLQQEALEAEIERTRAAMQRARNEEQRIALSGQLLILERQRADIAGLAAREQLAAERDLTRELDNVRMRLLDIEGNTAAARTMALEAEFRDLIQRLQTEGDAEGEALVRKLFNVEVARAQLNQIESEVNLTMSRMTATEQSIGAQRDAGLLSEAQARREIIALHERTREEVERLIPQMRELAEASGDPAAIERVRQLELRVHQLGVVADEVAQRINAAIETGLSDALHDFAMGTKTASEAFRSFADSVVKEINKIASQRLAESLLGMFGTTGGGSGGIGGFISGLLKHSGGVVGEGGQFRRIPGFAFAGAPRYHNGGIAGLRPDEVPAILRKREEVLTEDDPRHRANGGLGGGAPAADRMRFVLVDNRDSVADHLRSAEGEQVFVEMLQRNASVIRNL